MFTHTVTPSVTTPGGQVSVPQVKLTAGSERNIDELIPIGATDLEVNFQLAVAKCVSFWVSCDQPLALHFNVAVAGTPNLPLLANVPYQWYTGNYATFLLTVDVTTLFVTNASGVDAVLRIRALEDPTTP